MSIFYYQQSGDAKKPYLAQYSAVCEDTPVRESWINMKIRRTINNILNPLNIHFSVFLTEVFLERVDNIINWDYIFFYIIIIIHYF
jgi:hypothetical protein